MRGRCEKQKFCLRSRAVYTAKRRLSSVSRACIFAAQMFIFSFAISIFLGGNNLGYTMPSNLQVVHAWIIIEDEHSCDEVLKAGRYVVDEGKKCQ